MSKKTKTPRTKITDLPETAAGLSEEELRTVSGGLTSGIGGTTIGGGKLNEAHWTKKRVNTATGQSWDYDYEDDYSTY
jgi:hypothetical protein